jgi:uncharacterized protein (TIGR02246 family)
MIRVCTSLAIGALVSIVGCASTGSADDAKSRILKLDAEWSAAAEKHDLESVLGFWADDATVFPPGSPPLVGKPAIREYVAKSFGMPGFAIRWKTAAVVVAASGDLAYATGTNHVTFRDAEGKQVAVDGKAVTVWRRGAQGDWKCVIDIWNDVPPQGTP